MTLVADARALESTADDPAALATAERLLRPPEPSRPSSKARIPPELRWEVWERDDFTCRRCGARRYLTIDHVVPESKGGPMEAENLQTLCRSCNSSKGVES